MPVLKGELVNERSSWARFSQRVGARLPVLKGELVNEN